MQLLQYLLILRALPSCWLAVWLDCKFFWDAFLPEVTHGFLLPVNWAHVVDGPVLVTGWVALLVPQVAVAVRSVCWPTFSIGVAKLASMCCANAGPGPSIPYFVKGLVAIVVPQISVAIRIVC